MWGNGLYVLTASDEAAVERVLGRNGFYREGTSEYYAHAREVLIKPRAHTDDLEHVLRKQYHSIEVSQTRGSDHDFAGRDINNEVLYACSESGLPFPQTKIWVKEDYLDTHQHFREDGIGFFVQEQLFMVLRDTRPFAVYDSSKRKLNMEVIKQIRSYRHFSEPSRIGRIAEIIQWEVFEPLFSVF